MYPAGCPLPGGGQVDLPTASTNINGPAHATSSPLSGGPPRLCEDGQPFVTDPLTGRQVCLCALGLDYSSTAARLPLIRGTVKALGHLPQVSTPGLAGLDPSAFYSPLIRGFPDRPSPIMTPGIIGHHYPFEAGVASHPYGLIYPGLEMGHGALRKVATRETTGPLKEWLREHKKNPYPTKAEKVMLAIITKMTLTQVSTWFANARRRLKKENKVSFNSGMKGQGDDDDNENEDDDVISDGHGNEDDHEYDSMVVTDRDGYRRKHGSATIQGLESSGCGDSDAEEINVDSSDGESEARISFLNDMASGRLRKCRVDDRASVCNSPNQRFVYSSDTLTRLNTITSSRSNDYPHSRTFNPFASTDISALSFPREWYCSRTQFERPDPSNHDIETVAVTTVPPSPSVSLSSTKPSTCRNVKKSKIWSISEIINEKPSTSSAGEDHLGKNTNEESFSTFQIYQQTMTHNPISPSSPKSVMSSSSRSPSPSPSSVSKSQTPISSSTHSPFSSVQPAFRESSSDTVLSNDVSFPFSLSSQPIVQSEALFRLGSHDLAARSFLHRYQRELQLRINDSRALSPDRSPPTNVPQLNGLHVFQGKKNSTHASHCSQTISNKNHLAQNSYLTMTHRDEDQSDADDLKAENAHDLRSTSESHDARSDSERYLKTVSRFKLKSKFRYNNNMNHDKIALQYSLANRHNYSTDFIRSNQHQRVEESSMPQCSTSIHDSDVPSISKSTIMTNNGKSLNSENSPSSSPSLSPVQHQ